LGIRVGVYKPIETGVEDIPHDAKLLLEFCQKYNPDIAHLSPIDITAYTFKLPAAPYSADTERTIEISKLVSKFEELSKLCDLLLIEGAGGLMVPITKSLYMIDLIEIFEADTLLVTPSRLGCINETLLSMQALKSRDISFDWCVNLYEDREAFDSTTKPFYDTMFGSWWSVESGLDIYTRRDR
jgi:dethiobiotin synthetase